MHRDIVSRAYSHHPAVVVRVGDLVDAGTALNHWQSFFAIERPLLSSAIYLPARGNHESMNADLSAGTPTNYFNFFAVPSIPANEEYYAVRYDSTLFIGLSTEIAIPGAQTTWLSNTLDEANNDPSIRWKVAFFHRAVYSSGRNTGSSASEIANWHPLFRNKGVELVFSGHDHDYERSVVEGVQYLVIGGGGSQNNPVGFDPTRTIYSESVPHLVVMDVDGQQLTANTYRVDGSRMDGFTLSAPTP